jgi:Holliday junction DNA helicase RuvA
MISRLRGLLIEKHPPGLLLEVQGVGYEIEAPMSTFYHLPELNSEVILLTHLSIREDAHILYGFLSEEERSLFRTLIRISGIGPKLALNILSAMEGPTFTQCIQQGDAVKLTRIPGVGKKMAERLIVEMRDRLGHLLINVIPSSASRLTQGVTSPVDDAISALIALGYRPQEASRWVHAVKEEGLCSEMLIRRALQATL